MQTQENEKKHNFGPKFGPQKFSSWVLPLLDVRHCRKLLLSSILRKTYDPTSSKWQKNSFCV